MPLPDPDAPCCSEHPLEALYRRPGFLLRRAHQISVGLFEDKCAALQLTPSQFGVLIVLGRVEGLDQAAVSRALGFDRVTTMRVVNGLEERGFIRRVPDPNHGRRQKLILTEPGRRILDEALGPAEQAQQQLLSPLAPEEQATLLALLDKLCTSLEPLARTALQAPPLPRR